MPFFHYQTSIYRVPAIITGGTITEATIDGVLYRVHTWLNAPYNNPASLVIAPNQQLVAPSPTVAVEYLLVGGGGGGGASEGGGGGGGQVLTGSVNFLYRTYQVVVGLGYNTIGSYDNSRSRIYGPTVGLISYGGGIGGTTGSSGGNGASGGGAGSISTAQLAGGTALYGGNNGGSSLINNVAAGAGGGGWNGAGQNSAVNQAGNGGNGILINFNGTPTYYGPGGGGGYGSTSSTGFGLGGLGGGGNGATRLVQATQPTPNRGGGGGGGSDAPGYGSTQGGTGIVMIRYPLTIV